MKNCGVGQVEKRQRTPQNKNNQIKYGIGPGDGELSTQVALPFDKFEFVGGHFVHVRFINKNQSVEMYICN